MENDQFSRINVAKDGNKQVNIKVLAGEENYYVVLQKHLPKSDNKQQMIDELEIKLKDRIRE